MSPNAQRKLRDAYYAFHRFLYGTRSLVPDLPDETPTKPELIDGQLPDLAPPKSKIQYK